MFQNIKESDFVVVIGLGKTGLSVTRFLQGKGIKTVLMDTRACPPNLKLIDTEKFLAVICGRIDFKFLEASKKIILSPGLSKSQIGINLLVEFPEKVISDIDLFSAYCRSPIIGVTGTNGKTTVTTIISSMLSLAGYNVLSGGNIGEPALNLLSQTVPDFYILELSSFQLELFQQVKLEIGVLLNISPDHLDRHESFSRYIRIKHRILECSKRAIVDKYGSFVEIAKICPSPVFFSLDMPKENHYGLKKCNDDIYYSRGEDSFCSVKNTSELGVHNQLNFLAAIAACDVAVGFNSKMIMAIKNFRGLPHRIEEITTLSEVTFFDDSKATNIAAAVAGIRACLTPCGGVLILGGIFKGGDVKNLVKLIAENVHTVILIGESANYFFKLLALKTKCDFASNMSEAVMKAKKSAGPGEAVLLSPACSSLDMFKNYEDRGNSFKRAVFDGEVQ